MLPQPCSQIRNWYRYSIWNQILIWKRKYCIVEVLLYQYWLTLMLLEANLTIWQGSDVFQKSLHPCALDESGLSIERVNNTFSTFFQMMTMLPQHFISFSSRSWEISLNVLTASSLTKQPRTSVRTSTQNLTARNLFAPYLLYTEQGKLIYLCLWHPQKAWLFWWYLSDKRTFWKIIEGELFVST